MEQEKLNNAKRLCQGIYPALALLCQDVELSSQRMHFLYLSTHQKGHIATGCDEGSAYLVRQINQPIIPRRMLTPSEEKRILGICARGRYLYRALEPSYEIEPCPINNDDIGAIQNVLDGLLFDHKAGISTISHKFPMETQLGESFLESEMMGELKESWDAHTKLPLKGLGTYDTHIF
eukprot:11045060-Ditylum_brightwellii.AAC.1